MLTDLAKYDLKALTSLRMGWCKVSSGGGGGGICCAVLCCAVLLMHAAGGAAMHAVKRNLTASSLLHHQTCHRAQQLYRLVFVPLLRCTCPAI